MSGATRMASVDARRTSFFIFLIFRSREAMALLTPFCLTRYAEPRILHLRHIVGRTLTRQPPAQPAATSTSTAITILTGSGDHTARLWDVESIAEPHIFSGHTDIVTAVAYSPDGKALVTASATASFLRVPYTRFQFLQGRVPLSKS